jgi:copper resistance protein B precursor CopB/multicopper oxidase
VQPKTDEAFTIFAQALDRSGFARGTLAPRAGMAAVVPAMDPRPMRTMADMGMAGMGQGGMAGMQMGGDAKGGMKMDHSSMPGMKMDNGSMPGMAMDHGSMPGMDMSKGSGGGMKMGKDSMSGMEGMNAPSATSLKGMVGVDNVAMMPEERLGDPGEGRVPGRRVLTYRNLRALKRGSDPRPPSREIVLHLTGNMQRFMWGFDGKKFSEAGPIELQRNERVRITLINDTMMDHPIHLHGLWSELENGHGGYRPCACRMSTFRTILITAALAGMATAAHLQMQMPASQMPKSMPATATQPAMMPPVMDNQVFAHALLDQFEGRIGGPNSEFRWDGQAWAGTDLNKFWVKSESIVQGNGRVEDGRYEFLYDRAVTPYFDLQAGLRTDLDSGTTRDWAAFGFQGLLPYFFDLEATGYVSDQGHFAGRLKATYDLLITPSVLFCSPKRSLISTPRPIPAAASAPVCRISMPV